METLTIIRNEQTISLTEKELEKAYRVKELMYLTQDARNQLEEYYCIIENDPEDEGVQEFKEDFGFSFEEACDENSEKFILTDMAEDFRDKHDCNIADNEMWRDIIYNYINKIRRKK